MRSYRKPSTVVSRQPHTAYTELPSQDPILLNQIGQRLSLAAIEPAGYGEEQQPKDGRVDHERQLISHVAETACRTVDPKVGYYAEKVIRDDEVSCLLEQI